jgi:FMN-dependent NADH-azoreductase
VIVITSRGNGAFHPDGAMPQMGFLNPHLGTLLTFMGLTDQHWFDLTDIEGDTAPAPHPALDFFEI